ncbi:MAG: carboxyltransferase [Acidimicrobiia bacterium]
MHIDFVDQTLRDGQQSLWGLRMRAFQAAPALPFIDRTGFKVVDLTGAGMFQVLLRSFRDDPWASTDFLIQGLPSSIVRAGMRTISVIGFGFVPDSIVDLWIHTLSRHGVKSFWIYDCLFDMGTMHRVADVATEAGAQPVPAVMYGLTDLHSDDFFAARAGEIASWDGIETVYFEDAAGVLTPERAAAVLPKVKAATAGRRVELHCHNTTGLANLNYIEGLRCGIDILHTASRSMANGASLPSTEAMLETIGVLGHTHGLDTAMLEPVRLHFLDEAAASGYETGVPNEFSLLPYRHQLPGGMTGTLKAQLAEHGMGHRLREVLDEIVIVREDLGQPVMATPFSQLVGIQAVLNIVAGERYKLVPDEVIQYTLGHYGPLMRAVEGDVADRILSQPRAADFKGWERPQPSLRELRQRFGLTISDEELLLRAMHPDAEVDAMLASGPPRTTPRTKASEIVENIAELVSAPRSLCQMSVSLPELSITVRRNSAQPAPR